LRGLLGSSLGRNLGKLLSFCRESSCAILFSNFYCLIKVSEIVKDKLNEIERQD
jgi:hypothetical protein